ncbi:hypothetical protein V5O48_013588 [Marasmius crinis-equi]|uniref:NADP-dependent oxidoreductase domain-containing protein n=1 Tax=Marasmius crinis-equi TaxID=585013 RepID=A0ABR3EZT1_9AGAR
MSSIPLRKIGDADVPAIGFGFMEMQLTAANRTALNNSDEERLKVLNAAYEAGCTFWDADCGFPSRDSEQLIRKWFKFNPDKREEIFLATKVKGAAASEFIEPQVESALRRLGVDYIDLYYQNRVDSNSSIEAIVEAIAEQVKAGKIRHIGLSGSACTPSNLRSANSIHPISAIKVDSYPAPIKLIETAREFHTKIVANRHAESESNQSEKMIKVEEVLKGVGEKYGATARQTALAWALAQGDDLFVVPCTKRIEYVRENAGAGRIHLTPEDVEEIGKAIECPDTSLVAVEDQKSEGAAPGASDSGLAG